MSVSACLASTSLGASQEAMWAAYHIRGITYPLVPSSQQSKDNLDANCTHFHHTEPFLVAPTQYQKHLEQGIKMNITSDR